jgi:hypothetical protein
LPLAGDGSVAANSTTKTQRTQRRAKYLTGNSRNLIFI